MPRKFVLSSIVVNPVAPVSLVKSGEDLVRFVNHGEIEGGYCAEGRRTALAAGEFPADKVHARCEEARLVLACLDAEQI